MLEINDISRGKQVPPVGNLPKELISQPQWVGWKFETVDKRITKIPKNPKTGGNASAADPATWASIQEALISIETHHCDGVGFVFSKDDPYCGIDLDHCRDPETCNVESWAEEIVKRFNSYTEVSPSGTGLHILVRGQLPPDGRRKDRIELYDAQRYFTVTGNRIGGSNTVEDRQAELDAFHAEIFPPKEAVVAPLASPAALDLDDATLLARARTATNGAKFAQLFDRGGWREAGFSSQSEGDLALCGTLAFWTGRDQGRMDRLFRQSGLYRSKWDRPDYRAKTLDRAVAECKEVFATSVQPLQPLQPNATFCNRMQPFATKCNLLQPRRPFLQPNATFCNLDATKKTAR